MGFYVALVCYIMIYKIKTQLARVWFFLSAKQLIRSLQQYPGIASINNPSGIELHFT